MLNFQGGEDFVISFAHAHAHQYFTGLKKWVSSKSHDCVLNNVEQNREFRS